MSVERWFDAAVLPIWVLMLIYFSSQREGLKREVRLVFCAALVSACIVDGFETLRWFRHLVGS